MVYTLPHAIKEEKNPEKRVGNLESKREKVGKLKVKKRNERGGSEGLLFLFFISVQGSNERGYFNRRGRFLFLLNGGRIPRE